MSLRSGVLVLAITVVLSACGGGGGGSPASSSDISAGSMAEHMVADATLKGQKIVDRGYLLYIPEGYDPKANDAWPLIVFLHGSSSKPGYQKTFSELREDGLMYAITHGQVKPRALVVAPLSAARNFGFDRMQVDAVVREVQQVYRIDPHRVSLTGMSMGAIASWYLGMSYPNRFSAIAPVSGALIDEFAAKKTLDAQFWGAAFASLVTTPFRVSHGTADEVIPFEIGKHAADLLTAAGGQVDFRSYNTTHVGTAGAAFTQDLADWLVSQARSDADATHVAGLDATKYAGDYTLFKGWLGEMTINWAANVEPGTMMTSSPSWPQEELHPVLVYVGDDRFVDINGELISFDGLAGAPGKYQCIRFMYWTPILQTGVRKNSGYAC